MIVQTASHNTGFEGDDRLLSHVRADVSDLNFPGAYAPGMTLGYAGDVPAQVEELKGLIVDLSLSGLLVLLLVCGAVVWFFRSLMSLVVLGVPLVFGTFYTFALVALPPLSITALNSNTAFLGAIVVGNGINTGVIVLARYQEERSRGMTVRAALGLALRKTWKPTLGAAFAASAAYGSLIFTDFRGFNQFGWIGAVGMLACWGTTMALAPVLVHYVGAGIGARARVHAQAVDSAKGPRHRNVFAVAVTRYPRGILVVCLLATIASVFAMNARRNDWLENDFTNLRRRDSFVSGERYWSAQMDKTLETYLTPAVVMASSAQAAEIIERKIRGVTEQGGAGDLIARVSSVRSFVRDRREDSIDEATELAEALTPKILGELEPSQRRRLERALSDDALVPLGAAQVPDIMLAGLREFDGRADRNILIFPKVGAATWDRRRSAEFSADLRRASHSVDPDAAVTGPLLLGNDILDTMASDGPRATAIALGVVILVLLLALRSFGLSVIAMVSLVLGVAMTLGTMAWVGQRVNFANFVALPITFGIAADYSINVLQRYRQEGAENLSKLVAGTGGAVTLCSATTIIGFGSLLVAQNQGLFSFGVFAVAGEIACLATAVLVVPAYLAWFHGVRVRRGKAREMRQVPRPSTAR